MYEEYHIAVPLRDSEGQAIAAFDLNLGPRQKLSSCEHKDLQKALKMLQAATFEILKEDAGDLEPYYVLGIVHLRRQNNSSDQTRFRIVTLPCKVC